MKLKKVIVILLLVILCMTQFNFIAFINPVSAAGTDEVVMENGHYRYYYSQLSDTAKNIYTAMYEMYTSGDLKTGNAKYDLIEKGKITNDLVNAYRNGNNELIIAVETARDAFYLDYPEVFYVNMEKYSIRITSDSKGYHVWLGTGNNDSYYLHGFTNASDVTSAESAYNSKLTAIVNGAKALTAGANENLTQKQIAYVHEQVVKATTYKLDNVCKAENAGHIRTPYGALVAGESVCEGYSKAMKVALDKLEIPSILVRGIYTHEGSRVEAHMWNYVQIEGKWYAIDATFDDDDSETVSTRYLLAGDVLMSQAHTTDGVMSAPEFEFQYPALEERNYGVREVARDDGLVVEYETTDGNNGYDTSTFHISYKGMGFREAAKAGYHFIVKFYQRDKQTDEIKTQDWCYVLDDTDYFMGMIKDNGKDFSLKLYYMSYVEFAVTNVEIGPYNDKVHYTDQERLRYLWYLSDNDHMLAYSGLLECPDSDKYVPAPTIKSAAPYLDSKLKPGKATHIKLTFDENLVLADGSNEGGIKIANNAWTSSAEDNSRVTNFSASGKTVEFDFTPSSKWGDNSVVYYLTVTGMVGEKSKRAPLPANYYVQESFGCTYSMKTSGVWRAYARPTLVESADLSKTNWTLSDGSQVSGNLTDRLALVATQANSNDTKTMNDLIKKDEKKEILKSETYNIDLTLCGKTVVTPGHKLTVYLGFPEGYGPNDVGVTFKAYHFIYKYGEIAGVEEIPCVITPYGLLVTCSSFSPFAVIATPETAADTANTAKTVAITTGENGVITGLDSSIVELKSNETKTYTVQAATGYQIDNLTVLGNVVTDAAGKDSYEITLKYDELNDANNIVNANFVAKTVAAVEKANNENVVVPTLSKAKIVMPEQVSANVGEKVTIKPEITPSNGIDVYQWYKDGEELAGETKAELTIDAAKIADEGNYTLTVTSTLEAVTETETSTACKLLTSDFAMELEATKKTVVPGEVFEVNAYIKNIRNVNKGIVAFTGQLYFDKTLVEVYTENEGAPAIVGEDNWKLSAYNEDNFKFITESDDYINENTHLFTVYFKAKEAITTEKDITISLINASASAGEGVISPVSSANETVHVVIKEEVDEITSEVYELDNENMIISKVIPGSTVEEFRGNVDAKPTIVFFDKDGHVLADSGIITTGTTVRVGKDLEYTLAVIGDTDCDGRTSGNDLAQIKLHLIDKQKLTGIKFVAGNLDGVGGITINDLAQLKLIIIGKIKLK